MSVQIPFLPSLVFPEEIYVAQTKSCEAPIIYDKFLH